VPGLAAGTGIGLEIAARHVEAGGETEYVVERGAARDVAPAAAEREDEFPFVMQVVRARRIRHAAVQQDRVGWLEKEARWFPEVGPHLANVRGVILADTVDAMHRKEFAAAED